MKKITIFLAALLLVFAAGCREDASLDGLESQTKEEGTSAGENAESIAVKEALTYESALEYNWVAEYAPAAGKSYTILFNFLSDSSVATDSPVSENEKNLALFSVSALKEGGVIIKFDGPTMAQRRNRRFGVPRKAAHRRVDDRDDHQLRRQPRRASQSC